MWKYGTRVLVISGIYHGMTGTVKSTIWSFFWREYLIRFDAADATSKWMKRCELEKID